MFVFYEPSSLKIIHIVTHAPENYGEFLKDIPDQYWIEAEIIDPIDEIELTPELTIRRRQPMSIVHPDQLLVGVESTISNIPMGISIFINGEPQGVMDQSETLEFTPQTGGNYTFKFEGSGYIKKEFNLEAVIPN